MFVYLQAPRKGGREEGRKEKLSWGAKESKQASERATESSFSPNFFLFQSFISPLRLFFQRI